MWKKLSQKEVKEAFAERGYILIGEYVNARQDVEYRCPKHPKEKLFMTVSNLKLGKGCPHCAGLAQPKMGDIVKLFKSKGLRLLSRTYINNKTPLAYECECEAHKGIIQYTTYSDVLNSRKNGCPLCKASKGETKIFETLSEKGVYSEFQYKDHNCIDTKVLPFDFYVPALNLIIEYQGRQHYKANSHFGGVEGFRKLKKHDKMKKEYCKENGINFLEITFEDYDNIDEILSFFVSQGLVNY